MKSLALFALAALVCSFALSADAAVLPMAAVPDDGIIRLADYGYRDWGPEMLRYSIDTKRFAPGKLVLLGPDAAAVPFQIDNGVLCFVASVKKDQAVEYRLQASDADRSRENSRLVHRKTGNTVEIENAFIGIRLPNPQKKTFNAPIAAEQVPPPIIGFRQRGFGWVGGARFFTERKVRSYEIACTTDGPASVAYKARYRFAPTGEYLCRIRVTDGLKLAMISEEFDFGDITDGCDFLMLGIGEGWRPQQVGRVDNGQLKLEDVQPYLDRKAREQNEALNNVSSYTPPPPFMPGKNLVLLEKVTPTGAWGPIGAFELRATGTIDGREATQIIGLCPWHTGNWRRMMALQAWQDPTRGVFVALPISVRLSRWYLEVTDDVSPFSTHQHQPNLPKSYGCREWALAFGVDDIVNERIASGYVGLDRCKDWVIDWPEDPEKAKYPRAFTTIELLGRIIASLDQHPEKDLLGKLYLINGQPDSAVANARSVLSGMRAPYDSPWSLFGLPGYGQTYFRLAWGVYAEDALACLDLPPDLRTELRRHLALWAHFYAEPDYDPRAAGTHLGNPNMPIGRSSALAIFASLLPDHPMYEKWMTHLKTWTEFRLAINTSPGGAWFEPPTYKMYGPTRSLTIDQILLRNAGFGDLAKLGYHARALEYDANLTMPDPRFKGWRILPGMGNSGNTLEGVWGMGVGVVEQADPETAGFLRAMHKLCSGNERVSQGNAPDYSFFYLPDIPERPRKLVTTYVPGYGVAFRAHYGSPLETAMLFRAGYNKSHWDTDDLNVILYGLGAPLSPGTGYQYYYGPAMKDNAVCHNRCKPGDPNAKEPFGRVETAIQDYGFGENADYAVGREYYPPEFFADKKGEMEWRRHVLFLKARTPDGPNYFVMRDTFLGPDGKPDAAGRQAFWHWLNLDTADKITVDGKPFDKEKVPFNEVAADDKRPALRGRTLDLATAFGAGTRIWFAQPQSADFRAVMTFDYAMAPNYHHRAFGKSLGVPGAETKETKTIIRGAAPARDGFFYVVYPRKDGAPAPQCSMPAPGCIKIVTPESTDYVFAADEPFNFDQDGVAFTGKAGAVRIFKDRVALCMNSGDPRDGRIGRIGYKGCTIAAHGPLERVIALNALKPGITDAGGYQKKIVTVDVGKGISIRGEGPFNASLDGEAIRIRTTGRARSFTVTIPPFIIRPDLTVDGQRWMPGWTDWASSDWGRMKNSYLMAVSTLDGEHELVIKNLVFPDSPIDVIEPSIGKQ